MRILISAICAAALFGGSCLAESPCPAFEKLRLSDKFYCEGAFYADFNLDGRMDVVAGPFWYEGPDFRVKHEIYPPKAFDPKGYADVFMTFCDDFNGDGRPDVLHLPAPGGEAHWYENPADRTGHWKRHFALKDVGNESPMYGDVDGDGRSDLLFNKTGYLGFATHDPAAPGRPWAFQPATPKRDYHRYTHGVGHGDINGDGRTDVLESAGWWEQPRHIAPGKPWPWHPVKFAEAAAQILVEDVDGDGLNDVINAWHCHRYGLVWHEQVRNDKGEIAWRRHEILPIEPDPQSDQPRISQLHACALADIDGDGLKDVLTGKRFWAHGPGGDVEPNAPAVLYWFELQRGKHGNARFIPHRIDDDSGVGTQVAATDLNGDDVPDVIVGNKKGIFVHLSRPGSTP